MEHTIEDLAARRPPADYEARLSADDIAAFEANGFIAIDRITTDEEVAWLRDVYDCIFFGDDFQANKWDLVRPIQSTGEDRLPQIIGPELRFPVLMETAFWRNGRKLAAQLMQLAEDTLHGWGHMIRKPPRIGDSLPWHQDEAYWDPRFVYRALGCWLPLDDATPENGAMRFIPGSHKAGICEHRHVNDDPTTPALYVVVDEKDEERAVTAPLKAGGAIFHHSRTLHSSGPNLTDKVRRAYANEWQLSPQKAAQVERRSWLHADTPLAERMTAKERAGS